MAQLLNQTLVFTLLSFFDFVLFLLLLSLLKVIHHRTSQNEIPLSFTRIVSNFYIVLVASALVINFICYQLYAPYFNAGGTICFLLAGTCLYLCFLRAIAPFKYAVISQELPRLPLVITVASTLFGSDFCLFESLVQWKRSQALFLASLTDGHSPLEESNKIGQASHKDIRVATPKDQG